LIKVFMRVLLILSVLVSFAYSISFGGPGGIFSPLSDVDLQQASGRWFVNAVAIGTQVNVSVVSNGFSNVVAFYVDLSFTDNTGIANIAINYTRIPIEIWTLNLTCTAPSYSTWKWQS
jgi:hypothetical protein